jgi:Tfp pilus assembly protein PilO
MKDLLIAAAIFLSGSIAWFAFIYHPKHLEVSDLRSRIKDLAFQVQGLVAQDQQITVVEAAIDSLQRTIVNLEERIYPKDQFPKMAKIIEARGKQYDLHFSTIAPDYDALLRLDEEQRKEFGPLVILPVEFTVQGEYIKFGRFTASLGSLPFHFSITGLHAEATRESYPQIVARLQGVLYLTEAPNTPEKARLMQAGLLAPTSRDEVALKKPSPDFP